MWDTLRPLVHEPPENQKRILIPSGLQGTEATIAKMRELVTAAKRDGRIRRLAIAITKSCKSKDFHCDAQALHTWITENIKYLHDPPGVETLVAPWLLLEHRGGDCDDHVMLFASLCEAAGIPARFVCIKADPSQPMEFSHVFSQCFVENGWVTSDTTMPQHPFGWDPGPSYPRKTWPASFDKSEYPDGEAGMGRLGAESQQAIAEVTVPEVIAGRLAAELKQAWRDVNDKKADLQTMLASINTLPINSQGAMFDMWNRANAATNKEQASLQAAIKKHDELARAIQTWSVGKYVPPQTGLGAAPLLVVGVGAAAVLVAAYSFYLAMGAWRGDAETNKGYLTQLADALTAAGGTIEKTGTAAVNLGMIALVGLGGYVLYQFLKKRGTI